MGCSLVRRKASSPSLQRWEGASALVRVDLVQGKILTHVPHCLGFLELFLEAWKHLPIQEHLLQLPWSALSHGWPLARLRMKALHSDGAGLQTLMPVLLPGSRWTVKAHSVCSGAELVPR